jgi:hypothetical protein
MEPGLEVEMKQTADMQVIQEKMQPGKLTAEGFLGSDTRNLNAILLADQEAVNRMGTTHAEIADKMQSITDIGACMTEALIPMDQTFAVQVDEYMGAIPCPFSDHFNAAKRNTLLKNLTTGAAVHWTDLSMHMIREHGFYEGIGAYFRLDPEYLVPFLKK